MPNKLEFEGIALLVLLLVFLGLLGTIHYYKSELAVITAQFDSFKDKTAALGEQQKAANAEKEKRDAEKINAAVAGRDDALQRLRVAEAKGNSNRRAASTNPVAPAGSKQVCFESSAYTAAFREFGNRLDGFIQDARRLATEGDAAQIDATALLKSWPSPSPVSGPPMR